MSKILSFEILLKIVDFDHFIHAREIGKIHYLLTN